MNGRKPKKAGEMRHFCFEENWSANGLRPMIFGLDCSTHPRGLPQGFLRNHGGRNHRVTVTPTEGPALFPQWPSEIRPQPLSS